MLERVLDVSCQALEFLFEIDFVVPSEEVYDCVVCFANSSLGVDLFVFDEEIYEMLIVL
jgi:hypothetical protein